MVVYVATLFKNELYVFSMSIAYVIGPIPPGTLYSR